MPHAMNDSSRAGVAAFGHRTPAGERFPALLLILFAILWIVLAVAPLYRQDWLLENLIVLVAVPWLVWCHRRLRLSNLAYAAIFLFLALHEVGAHYRARMLLGISPDQAFGLARNHYDRALHFLYGLLITPAAMELLAARAPPSGIWRWILPVTFVMSHSVVYELVEWAAALVFGGDLGEAYLGTQGDPWDAQHDMLLAAMGSMLAVLVLRRFPYRAE